MIPSTRYLATVVSHLNNRLGLHLSAASIVSDGFLKTLNRQLSRETGTSTSKAFRALASPREAKQVLAGLANLRLTQTTPEQVVFVQARLAGIHEAIAQHHGIVQGMQRTRKITKHGLVALEQRAAQNIRNFIVLRPRIEPGLRPAPQLVGQHFPRDLQGSHPVADGFKGIPVRRTSRGGSVREQRVYAQQALQRGFGATLTTGERGKVPAGTLVTKPATSNPSGQRVNTYQYAKYGASRIRDIGRGTVLNAAAQVWEHRHSTAYKDSPKYSKWARDYEKQVPAHLRSTMGFHEWIGAERQGRAIYPNRKKAGEYRTVGRDVGETRMTFGKFAQGRPLYSRSQRPKMYIKAEGKGPWIYTGPVREVGSSLDEIFQYGNTEQRLQGMSREPQGAYYISAIIGSSFARMHHPRIFNAAWNFYRRNSYIRDAIDKFHAVGDRMSPSDLNVADLDKNRLNLFGKDTPYISKMDNAKERRRQSKKRPGFHTSFQDLHRDWGVEGAVPSERMQVGHTIENVFSHDMQKMVPTIKPQYADLTPYRYRRGEQRWNKDYDPGKSEDAFRNDLHRVHFGQLAWDETEKILNERGLKKDLRAKEARPYVWDAERGMWKHEGMTLLPRWDRGDMKIRWEEEDVIGRARGRFYKELTDSMKDKHGSVPAGVRFLVEPQVKHQANIEKVMRTGDPWEEFGGKMEDVFEDDSRRGRRRGKRKNRHAPDDRLAYGIRDMQGEAAAAEFLISRMAYAKRFEQSQSLEELDKHERDLHETYTRKAVEEVHPDLMEHYKKQRGVLLARQQVPGGGGVMRG